ncbi:hypothetical protein GCM10010145_08690 [Streptomyces ruber]|uniref:Metallophosphoesterase n=2 Tax=Streptomyces TaxID=1883 RepID=A0A918B7X1_9ACTN|nr:SAV_2336 N-terminal domain-related protein [Streptomyces ruber]GGQ42235.1 hypothetical protein GCM10010145_08690 [Streptomyces ruber]
MPDAAARHGPATGPSPDPISELIVRLRAGGLELDAEELCDALWLARWSRPPNGDAEPFRPTAPGVVPREDRGPLPGAAATATAPPVPHPPAPPETPYDEGGDRRVVLYPVPQPGAAARAGGPGHATALPVGVPAAPAFPSLLELQRVLRPLQGYRSPAPPLRSVLDETATAELSARAGGLIMPVHRAVTRADARLQLVMDASSSMRVWDRMFTELELVFARLGAFWDIQVSHLHEGPDGEPAVSRSPEAHAAPLHAADRLSDPTGRRITLLVSDCAGPLWRSGRAHRLLHHLARQAPAAVLQPLPQRMWNRTRLPVVHGELTRGEALGGAASLRVRPVTGAPPEDRGGALPVPVLPPEPVALGAWARLLSGAGAGPVSGAVGWVRADQPPVPAGRPARRSSAPALVSRFRSTASPAAGRLAVHLAAAPLCLPVMQLVQRTMLPDSGPAELAEVLLGGLLTRAGTEHGADGGQWYEFAPGVQEALLTLLGRDEAMLVLKHCSEYIEQRFGKGGPNFPALALAQLGDGGSARPYGPPGAGIPGRDETPADSGTGGHDGPAGHGGPGGSDVLSGIDGLGGANGLSGLDAGGRSEGDDGGNGARALVPQPFAEVAARVLERFMPLPDGIVSPGGGEHTDPAGERPTHTAVTRARDLVARFDREGMVQDLIDAVQFLRRAAERRPPGERDPRLWAEYALSLLRLWEVQGGADLLREAETAAERAVAHPGAVRERAVLARVLRTAATDRRRRGDRRGALDLLRRADREYAVACAAPDLEDDEEALRLTLERVGALETQWRLGGDSALLQGAVGMLEAFADAWPDRDERPPGLPLAHGRVLLRLSGATADPEQARLYAEQAARSLRTALDARPDDTAPPAEWPRERVRVLLGLVDALLRSGGSLDDARTHVGEALSGTREQGLRASLLVRAGRIHVAAYEESGDPRELQEAAGRFEEAAHRMPRDASAHADVLAEWGETLLRRAALEGGTRSQHHLSRAVRVLRDCRTETPAGDGRLAYRLLLLGRALMLRYRARGDRVDLREAEHLFGLAAADADDALLAAGCWLELGQAQFEAYSSLGRPARLDEAVDAFRRAAEAAREAAEETAGTDRRRREAVQLGAQAHHWRGMSYEAAARPRAAREAYRSARAEWSRLPDDTVGTGEPTARQTAQRLAELE